MLISYMPGFIERVKAEYEDRQDIILAAEKGEYTLGHYLAIGADMSMGPEQIVEAFRSGDGESVLVAALATVRRRRLHQEWIKIMANKFITIDNQRCSMKPPSSVGNGAVFHGR